MHAVYLRFYVTENQRHGHKLLYEWLLEAARELGVRGGSAFRAMAGFGRHGVIHDESFFELAGELPVQVAFVLSEPEARRLLAHIAAEHLELVYTLSTVEYGVTGETPG
jgi:uncharacterized protein